MSRHFYSNKRVFNADERAMARQEAREVQDDSPYQVCYWGFGRKPPKASAIFWVGFRRGFDAGKVTAALEAHFKEYAPLIICINLLVEVQLNSAVGWGRITEMVDEALKEVPE